MTDRLYRFTFEQFAVRGAMVSLDASWRALVDGHDYAPPVRDYLGQTLAAATMLSCTIKFKGSLILQLQGDGPLRTLVAQATERRTIRGMALAVEDVPDSGFAGTFGTGRLTMTAESPRGERFQGIVVLQGESIAQVLEAYFHQSEQLATRIWLAAGRHTAAGLLLQRLPGAQDDAEDWRRVCLLADTLTREELLQQAPTQILRRLFHEELIRLYEPEPVAFRCSCSRERIDSVLRLMGQREVESIVAEQGAVEANCEFCNARYRLDAVDVAGLFADSPPLAPSESQH
jgi:molecular chaperone Hsp33